MKQELQKGQQLLPKARTPFRIHKQHNHMIVDTSDILTYQKTTDDFVVFSFGANELCIDKNIFDINNFNLI